MSDVNMELHEAAVLALGESSTVEEVNELVAVMENLQAISMLSNDVLARAIAEAGEDARKSLGRLFELTRSAFEQQEPNREAPPSLTGRSLESIFASDGKSLEEIVEEAS